MPVKRVQILRGSTDENNIFVGLQGELTVDTDKNTVVVHDGATMGGFPLKVAVPYLQNRYLTFRAALVQQGIANIGFTTPNDPSLSPTAVVREESSGLISGAAQFDFGANQSIQDHFMLPPDWVSSSALFPDVSWLDLDIIFRCPGVSGSVVWKLESCCVSVVGPYPENPPAPPDSGGILETTVFDIVQTAATPISATSYGFTLGPILTATIPVLTDTLSPGSEYFFRLSRDTTDTLPASVDLLTLRFTLPIVGK